MGIARESLGKALVTCPQLLGVGIDSLRTGLEFLRSLGIPRYLCMYCIICMRVYTHTKHIQNTHTHFKTHTHTHIRVFVGVLVRYII